MSEEEAESGSNQEIIVMLREMLIELRAVHNILNIALISDTKRLSKYVESVIGNSKRRADVFLATDGERNASAIAKHLGMKRPNVSIEQGVLLNAGLIQPHIKIGKGYIYRKSSIREIIEIAGLLLLREQQQEGEEEPTESSNPIIEGESSARE